MELAAAPPRDEPILSKAARLMEPEGRLERLLAAIDLGRGGIAGVALKEELIAHVVHNHILGCQCA